MFPLWAGFCAVIFIEATAQKRFSTLGKYIAGFCIGMLLVCAPVFLYLKTNGLLEMFFVQVVQGGAKRGFSGISTKEFLKNFYVTLNRSYSFIPLFYGVYRVITGYKKNNFIYYIAYTFSYILMVFFISVTIGNSHYNMVLIPFYIPAFSFFAARLYDGFSNLKYKKLCFALFACIVCSQIILKAIDDCLDVVRFHEFKRGDSGQMLIRAGKMIDDNTDEGDTIISLGIDGYIYLFTQRNPTSRFFHQAGIDTIPNAKNDFVSDVINRRPRIIAILLNEDSSYGIQGDFYAPIFEMIERDYRLLSDENGYVMFVLDDTPYLVR
jgi:hypothetical protein